MYTYLERSTAREVEYNEWNHQNQNHNRQHCNLYHV